MCTCKPQQCFGETQVQLLKYINGIIKFKEYENLALKIFSLHVYTTFCRKNLFVHCIAVIRMNERLIICLMMSNQNQYLRLKALEESNT